MFIVRTVSIEALAFQPHTYSGVDLRKAIEYSKRPSDTAPPIDTRLVNGAHEIENGFHRYCAALIRGDKEIRVSFWEG